MRLLYVLYRYPQISQTFVRDEIWALRRAGCVVDVISLDGPGDDPPAETWAGPYRVVRRPAMTRTARDLLWWAWRRPHRLARFLLLCASEPRRLAYMVSRIPSEARTACSGGECHVHTHFAWDTATVAAGLATLMGASRSITVHAKDIYAQPIRTVRRRLEAFDRVITVCHFNVGFMAGSRCLGPLTAVPRVVPCGVDTEERLDRQMPTTDVVAVGRLVEKKGFDILLHALSEVDPDVVASATIIGDGPDRGALEKACHDLGIDGRVTFSGALSHEDALRMIGTAKVFCLPSRIGRDGDSDAMPVVIREAMARGVPVIASRLAGIPESVDDEVGWLVEPGSVGSLVEALRKALGDEGACRERGKRGYERARDRWRFDAQAGALQSIFEGLPRADAPSRDR